MASPQKSWPLLVVVVVTFVLVDLKSITGQPEYVCFDLSSDGTPVGSSNVTANSSNLASLLDSLSAGALNNSFFKNSYGGIFGLFLCRGDEQSCRSCVLNATQTLPRRCPSKPGATIWYEQCMLRYSHTNFFGVMTAYPIVFVFSLQNNTSPDEQDVDALALMYNLLAKVPYSAMMYGVQESSVGNGSQRRYALAQCTRDLNSTQCRSCLSHLSLRIRVCCQGKKHWQIMSPSCGLRYEDHLFYRPPSSSDKGKGGKNTTKIIAIALSLIIAVAAFPMYCFFLSRHIKNAETSEQALARIIEHSANRPSGEIHFYDLPTIATATNDFADANKLGEGGFGPVFKGQLPDGKEIAVKRLSTRSSQGVEEFKTEVMVVGKLQHRNLVRLLGCCLEGGEKILVYEYLANCSLDSFLFDAVKRRALDWTKRLQIINGIAKGLLYLHEDSRLKIIHRDMKASNILLDDDMNPKISDFGTARIFGGNQIQANTNRVVGTFGYMAPEYAMEGLFSVKSDVYSFGVLLLEILSGRKRSFVFENLEDGQSLVSSAWRLWKEGKGTELIDANLISACPINEALRLIHLSLLCIQEDQNLRPTMSTVILMLGSKADLPQPKSPSFSIGTACVSDQLMDHLQRSGPSSPNTYSDC